ncbi:MAG TPA: type II secretion system F family protein [Terriglobales bacterium]|nr:type II secretion system F family protein [Terriglobales bacterium]
MARYRYVAYDSAGRRLTRAVAAQSDDQVKRMLWDQGLHIVDIRTRTQMPSLEELFPSFVRVRRSEVILFTRQLATFVRVGMPIVEGLGVLRDQAGSNVMKRALGEMIMDLGTGAALSAAMARFPRIFPALYVDMIRSAEVSGNLDEVLRQLATYMARDEGAKRKVRSAMIYPAIVVGLALVVISVLIGFVLPAFANLFGEFQASMPLPTMILLAVGQFCREHALLMFVTLAALVGACAILATTQSGHDAFDTIVLRLPMLGVIVRYAVIERYMRTLGTLAQAGVPITKMLDTAITAVGNAEYRIGLASVREDMLSGEGFAGPLERTGLFPRLVIQMVRVGEETGSLDANLEQAAEHYAEEVDYRLKRMIAVIEPALVIAVGVMVGFIAVSVIAPMYALVHAIH